MQNINAKTASNKPALNSLPHGAGKCPTGKLKLIFSGELLKKYIKYPDRIIFMKMHRHENFSGIL